MKNSPLAGVDETSFHRPRKLLNGNTPAQLAWVEFLRQEEISDPRTC